MPTDPPMVELRTRFPSGFENTQIVYRELSAGPGSVPHYSRIDMARRYDGHLRLKRICRQILAGEYTQIGRDEEEASPHILDIPIRLDSYIVISLAHGTPSFRPPGITLTSDNAAYGALRYVDAYGNVGEQWPETECRLLYFHARHKRNPQGQPYYKQGFNFHVPQIRTRLDDSGIIDPDIRFPGVGGNGMDDEP